jgi:diaminopimelate epimerase
VSAQTFVKVEGLGNDFVILDRTHQSRAAVDIEIKKLRTRAPQLCDRRRGVGADGILVIGPPMHDGSHAKMTVINFDGSRPEMCGNGLRCVAHYIADHLRVMAPIIDTDAGIKPCTVTGHPEDVEVEVEVDMGPGEDQGSKTPASGEERTFASVSMGNPHAIHFVGDDDDPEALARRLGPALEVDEAYPDRTNVEFARVDEGDRSIVLWVWERGCGITDACGTGACATACAAVWAGKLPADEEIRVVLPGGPLTITVPSDRQAGVKMRGPSRRVFTGTVVV